MKTSLVLRFIFFILGIFLVSYAHATNYYLSASGNDANTGKTPNSPWRSLSKIPPIRSLLVSGDSVLLRRGDTFVGSISMLILNSDLSKSPVVISCYGDPDLPLPIFSGIRTVTGNTWVLANKQNVYAVTLTPKESFKYPSYFFRNGAPLPLGRYPNFNLKDAGGIIVKNVTTSGSIAVVQDSLVFGPKAPNWIGGEFVTMPRYWLYSRGRITAIDTSLRSATISVVGYAVERGKGFFIQNHLNSLDQEGEWAYDNSLGIFYLYTERPPLNDTFSYTLHAFGIDFSSNVVNNVVIENIHFSGFTDAAIRFNSSLNGNKIVIQNCKFTYCHDGLSILSNDNIIVRNNIIQDCRNNGITISAKNSLVERNLIKRIALDPGSGEEFNNHYIGINFLGKDGVCRLNRIDSVGFNGIRFEGQNLRIERNEISNFTMNKHDGGGIYSFNGFYNATLANIPNYQYGNNIIKENIIYDGITSDRIFTLYDYNNRLIGSNRSGGVYSDNDSYNNHIIGNIIYNMRGAGVLMSSTPISDSITVEKNIFYNCQHPDMLMIPQNVRNHLVHYNYNPSLSADPSTKTFTIIDNIFIETFPIKNFYFLSKNSKGKAKNNTFFRFDYNLDPTLFAEIGRPSIPLSISETQSFGSDLQSKMLSVQPQLRSPVYGSELLSNGTFTNGVTNWNFTRFNLNSSLSAPSSPIRLDGPYGQVAVIGGSFTAINKYFQLSQPVQVTANKLYELRFSHFASIGEDTTSSISVMLGNSRTEFLKVKNSREEVILYLIPFQSGIQNLTIRVNVPRISSYYFDNFSLKEISNYSTSQSDYELFIVNNSEIDKIYTLPLLPKGWYYYDPNEKSFVSGTISIAPFKALYLIKTNVVRKSNASQKILIK